MAVIREKRFLSLDDQIAERYYRVPFDVADGVPSIEVTLRYDSSRGVIDLGCEGPSGWRGWSGGARQHFVIAADDATPGYLPGEPEGGTWHVILGLHKLPAGGLEVTLEITTPAQQAPEEERRAARAAQTARGSERGLPAVDGLRWYAGDFHAHTVHSDGSESVSELAARGVRSGLDFVAVTDHNTVSHHRHLPHVAAEHNITLLPGQEVTTARGHANAFGDIGWVDFRKPVNMWVQEVGARGGVLSINHPVAGDCSWQHPMEKLPAAIELWHISWFRDLAATEAWAFLQRWGTDVTLLGGSDFHRPEEGWTLGTPITWVAAEDSSPEAILEGVKRGRTAISASSSVFGAPNPFEAPVLLRVADDVIAIGADGALLVDMDGRSRRVLSDHQAISSSWGRGPLHLQDAEKRLLAIV